MKNSVMKALLNSSYLVDANRYYMEELYEDFFNGF